ncbi:hypothetical protein ACFSTA_15745 [Ornithinibacillus salinisoli]|uniref:Uncharacterized protein n=2 Tax=Ornithinibacillus salinisoli TaxID=1848459 RepID=A0ABW4VZV9_9BACI
MQQSHQICYAEYSRKLEMRMAVEKRRHEEYEKCKHMIAELDNQLHK